MYEKVRSIVTMYCKNVIKRMIAPHAFNFQLPRVVNRKVMFQSFALLKIKLFVYKT